LAVAGLGLLATWACDGSNLFAPDRGLDSTTDVRVPTVSIESPAADPITGLRLSDSLFVRVSVSDDQGVDTVAFTAVAFRGDPDLGTARAVERFQSKLVTFEAGVTDTTLTRFLAPQPGDTARENVYLIVSATDGVGNVGADTVQVALGGPRVALTLADSIEVEEGKTIAFQITANDPRGVKSLSVVASGAFRDTLTKTYESAPTEVSLDTLLVVPAGTSGDVTLTVMAENGLGVKEETADTAALLVVDGTPPVVAIETPSPDSVTGAGLRDSVLVRVRVSDNFGVDSVAFQGFSIRGDAELGTAQAVERYAPKTVALSAVRDTTLIRFLAPLALDVKERVFIVVRAIDGVGKAAADTALVALGGPEVALEATLPDSAASAGDTIALTFTTDDPDGVAQLRVDIAGVDLAPIVRTFDPPDTVVAFDTTLVLPADFTGQVTLTPSATNTLGVSDVGSTVTFDVVDRTNPTVDILQPRAGTLAATPLGDSLEVEVSVSDNVGIDTVEMSVVAFRGDRDLGTDSVVTRYAAKQVALGGAVRDTTVRRFLDPVGDSIKEQGFLIARVVDASGNMTADTTPVFIGGPDVQIQNVKDGQSVQEGLNMSIRLTGKDPLGLVELRLDVTGALDTALIRNFNPAVDTVTVDTTLAIPAGLSGALILTATARNTLDVSGQDGPVTVVIVSGGAGDTIPPVLLQTTTSGERLELQDTVFIELTGSDDSQGSGVAKAGFTVLGISPSRGDTVIRSGQQTFDPPRTGAVAQSFSFEPFNVDSVALPDSLIFEITTYLVDADGNCAAATGSDTTQSFACDTLATGEIVAKDLPGQRLNRTIVSGTTVRLPTGGLILDAVVDTLRRNLLLSNFARNRVEVFRLQQESFLPAIAVGSQPWGLAINTCAPLTPMTGCGDTLIVANSGGTNMSNVYLGPSTGEGPAVEDAGRRFLMPDVVLFDIESALDDLGNRRYNVTILPDPNRRSFSDRPQFIARDSTGRILFSTRVVEALDQVGTIRKAFVPPGLNPADARPEVKMFVRHGELINSPDFTAVTFIDDVDVTRLSGDPNDQIIFTDHELGLPNNTFQSAPDEIATSIADLQGQGSDIFSGTGRWSVDNIGFHDTTYVASSGDGGWVVFGDGASEPFGRVIMYEAATDQISTVVQRFDLITNEGEIIRGIGLNYDGTLGVARGNDGYFFTTDLRIQGQAPLSTAGTGAAAGAVLHPLHANYPSISNNNGTWHPDTHLAFFGTGDHTIDIYDTFTFLRVGRVFIKDIITGPLRASLPFPEDQIAPDGTPFQCAFRTVTDQVGNTIGQAVEIYQGEDFNNPWPADGGAGGTEDRCVVLKLYGTTSAGGVVVVNVRKSDVLREHPSRN